MHLDLKPPLLVFGGPYSNRHALAALRRRAGDLGIPPSRAICTGDVVAYCGEPEETAQAIREWGCHVIAGNCEEQLAAAADDCACGFEEGTGCAALAKGWYPFANARMSAASRAWMAALPRTVTFALGGLRFRVVHGSTKVINRFVFASQREAIAAELDIAGADIVIAGHAGLPFIGTAGMRVWFNPGVIGMPANDGTPDGWYGLIRMNGGCIELSTHRLAYDHAGAAAATRRGGHADEYARALETGRWPSLDILPPAERAAAGQRIEPVGLAVPIRAPAEADVPRAARI